MMLAFAHGALATLDGVELVAIIYLALGISKLRERIAELEGRIDASRERLRRKDE